MPATAIKLTDTQRQFRKSILKVIRSVDQLHIGNYNYKGVQMGLLFLIPQPLKLQT